MGLLLKYHHRSPLSQQAQHITLSSMSIFSSFKKGKKVADQKKTQVDATKQATTTKPVEEYRHVIAHAARDAVTGAPSGWKDRDRHTIKHINSKRNSMMSRESSYVGQSGFPRSQSFNSDASSSQYHRSHGQRQMQGRTVRSTSYLNDQSSSRMSMPHRLETRHHSYQGRFGYAANGAYVGAAQPFMPSPLATSRKFHNHKALNVDTLTLGYRQLSN